MVTQRKAADHSIHSVDRAILILQALAHREVATVAEIAAEVGVHKSTVSRLVGTMEARGLVEQTSGRGRYRLGYGVVQLAVGASKAYELVAISRPMCLALAEAVGETVNLVVRDGRVVINIDQAMGTSAVTTTDWIGHRHPLHATAAGKLFLAHLSSPEFTGVTDDDLERFTPHTIVDATVLARKLEAVREVGFAASIEEQVVGMAALAAPIRDREGEVAAALTVSGPTYRIDKDAVPAIAKLLMTAADEISNASSARPRAGRRPPTQRTAKS